MEWKNSVTDLGGAMSAGCIAELIFLSAYAVDVSHMLGFSTVSSCHSAATSEITF